VRGAVLALGLLTRVPVIRGAVDPRDLSRAAAWFPVVGLLVGAAVGGVHALALLVLPGGPATVLALVAGILLTGALHEDGLADTADALGATVSRERRLEIMRDSRVGTYGALAVVLPLLLAYAVLSPLDGESFAEAVIVAHVLARWSTLPQALLLPPARADGSGAAVRVGPLGLVLGTAFAAGVTLLAAGPAAGAAAFGGAVVLGLACGLYVRRTLGGVTGDTLGAVNKLTEVQTYLVLT
jgi:adenosylcobinamide-GDP ribazoletransferase